MRDVRRQSDDARIRAVRRALWRDGRKRLVIRRGNRARWTTTGSRYEITSADGLVIADGMATLDELELIVMMHAITCSCDP